LFSPTSGGEYRTGSGKPVDNVTLYDIGFQRKGQKMEVIRRLWAGESAHIADSGT
jgi:hypothetical protein